MEGLTPVGGIAQLGEHELCKLGVAGSNPAASTIRPAVRGSWRAILAKLGLALKSIALKGV